MEFLSLLRRRIWVVNVFGILLGAALAGQAAANLFAAALPQPAAEPRPTRPASRAPSRAGDKSIDGIVGRNVFCSTCGSTPAPAPRRHPYALLAIMVAPTDWRWSVAIIRDYVAWTTGPYGVGSRLGDATVGVINNTSVVLDFGQGREEVLELLGPSFEPSDRCGAPPEGIAEAVRRTGRHTYDVPRSVIDRLLAGGVTPPWPRIVPQGRNGALVGFRVFGIGHDSPFAAIGLADGDLLLAVNGRSIATPEAAMAAFAPLRAERHIWLEVERDDRRLRMDYFIR
jgi:general secretion pathway protein C